MTKEKIKRATLKEPKDYVKFEPYKSIINALKLAPSYCEEFKEGLETKELRCLIVKGYTVETGKGFRNKKRAKKITLIKDYKKKLEWNSNVKLNQDISTTHQGFNKYLEKLDGIWIERKNGICFLSEKRKFELLRLRQKDIIMNTGLEYSVFHPSPGHSYTYYIPRITTEYLIQSVKGLKNRVEKVEENLKKAQAEWLGILSEARDVYLKELWNRQFLQNNEIYVLTKFDFCLDTIFDRRIILLLDISLPEKTLDEQWDSLMDIKKRAFEKYIQKRYPTLTQSQIEEVHKKIEKEYKLKKEFFDGLSKKIKQYGSIGILEHIIVLDFLGIGKHRYEELVAADIIKSASLNRGKSVGEIYDELKKSSEKEYPYDTFENKDSSEEHTINSVNEKLYVKPPFFKSFFQGFEKELKELGFKKNKLEDFCKDLDETAMILRLPSLHDDPADLL